ncbi:glycosyltransferase [Pontibacter sp. E15-1]|uniref:glycosyltransferase n=1 Tax=Pontibacter sp. E15-1 TaxID=2919918 RepID=UPI001F4FE1C6|nr:glycosyltransferase [Pontibacter sp. E15-1]MCJ8166332.1 glycosyltransferase [Pontibacter sp. E15-1]
MKSAIVTRPVVSVCMITYNHEKFITQAIEGVLKQKTQFPVELIIGDDCSTDSTRAICIDYQNRYPQIIKLRLPDTNLGVMPNFIENLKACGGKYIALCEGDDYWNNPTKLQCQIDFLEANPEYVLSFHDALVIHQNKNQFTETFKERFEELRCKTTFTHKNVVEKWFMPTASIVFKNNLIRKWPEWFNKVYSGDYTLQLLVSQFGLIKFHDEIWCTHIKHERGISQRIDLDLFRLHRKIYQYDKYICYFDKKYRYLFSNTLLYFYKEKLKLENISTKKIEVKLRILVLKLKIRYLYYYQQFSASELKAKAMHRFLK